METRKENMVEAELEATKNKMIESRIREIEKLFQSREQYRNFFYPTNDGNRRSLEESLKLIDEHGHARNSRFVNWLNCKISNTTTFDPGPKYLLLADDEKVGTGIIYHEMVFHKFMGYYQWEDHFQDFINLADKFNDYYEKFGNSGGIYGYSNVKIQLARKSIKIGIKPKLDYIIKSTEAMRNYLSKIERNEVSHLDFWEGAFPESEDSEEMFSQLKHKRCNFKLFSRYTYADCRFVCLGDCPDTYRGIVDALESLKDNYDKIPRFPHEF